MGKCFFYLLLLPFSMGVFGWQGWLWWSWTSAAFVSSVAADDFSAAEQLSLSSPSAPEHSDEDAHVLFEVPVGTSAQQIGSMLAENRLIRSHIAWNLWTRWQTFQEREGGFLAGTYALSPYEPMNAIANQIWEGDVLTTNFVIPEGWTIIQMAQYFEERGWFTAQEFIVATREVSREQYPWLPAASFTLRGANLEGFLYPSTYQISDNPSAAMVVSQMLGQFEKTALSLYQSRQQTTPYTLLEWVTLASIVEREAVVAQERPTIAAVFARRLRENIPLATDPTVEYAFGIRQTPERPLTYAEVGTPHPYNTYINVGLPPGAIAAPGLASLDASLNPSDTDYLFFMARFDGTHIFSSTLSQHEAAKNQVGAKIKAGEKPWEDD